MTDVIRTSNPCNVAPETDLKTGTIHVCSMGDGTRVLVRGDLLVLWRDGVQASMTGKQWLVTMDEIERHRIEAEKFDIAVASRDLEIEHLQRHIRDRGIPSAFEQSSPQAYVDGLAPETCDAQDADRYRWFKRHPHFSLKWFTAAVHGDLDKAVDEARQFDDEGVIPESRLTACDCPPPAQKAGDQQP